MKKMSFVIMLCFCTGILQATSLVQEQLARTADIKAQIDYKVHTPSHPLVVVNPYGLSPLSALVAFKTKEPATVTVTIFGKDPHTTIVHSFSTRTKKHLLPIYGLYPGDNQLQLTVSGKTQTQSYPLTITTEKILPLKTQARILQADPQAMKPGFTFVTPGVIVNPGSFAFAFDKNGDIRWVLTHPIMGKMSPWHFSKEGTILVGSDEFDPKYTVAYHSLYEIDLLGRVHHTIKAEDDIQHDIVKLANGNYLALVNATGKSTIADTVVELTPKNKVVDRFDIDAILGVEHERIPRTVEHYLYKDNYKRAKMDAMHLNSLNYDPEDDSIIMTARFFNFLLKVDRKTKQIKWILANPLNAWISPALQDKLLTPTTPNFDYIYGAHAAKPQGNHHFTVLDNGLYRDIFDKGANGPIDSYTPSNSWSRGVEFDIDETNKTVSVYWQYKRGPELYNHYLGDVDKFDEGHYLVNFGDVMADKDETISSVESSLNPSKQPAKSFAKIIEVKDGKVVFEAETDGLLNNTIYRVERQLPYLNTEEYKWSRK